MFGGWAGEELHASLTLYTDAYVVSGTLTTRQRRLTDILNHADDDFLVITDATLSEFGRSTPAHRASFAQVNLSAVLFAVTDEVVEPVPELRTPKISEAALISIPPFRVTGRIHILPERDLHQALQELVGRFLPITEATFESERAGVPATSVPMIAINHARAQILSPFGTPTSRPGRTSPERVPPEPPTSGSGPAPDTSLPFAPPADAAADAPAGEGRD